MSQQRWRPILWFVIYILLLITAATPIGVITVNFLMVPVIVMYATIPKRSFFIGYAASLLVVALLLQLNGLRPIVYALYLLPPALVLGRWYTKKESSAVKAVFYASITLIAESLLFLLVFDLFGINIVSAMKGSIHTIFMNYYQNVPSDMQQLLNQNVMNQSISMIVHMIPLMLVSSSIWMVFVHHWIARAFLKKMNVPCPSLGHIREWRFPKSLLVYYVVALILDFFITESSDSYLSVLLMNLIPFLMAVFVIQALSFLFFISHRKKWKIWLPIVGIIVCLLPAGALIMSMVGVFDVAIPLRERFMEP